MKKSALLIVVAMMLAAQVAKSQNLIAVQNGGAPAFYLQVDDAILNSQDGDTIYIPGGTWNLTQPINKRLHIIGVGHNPDSTNATFPTKLIGALSLAEGSSSGSLTGIFLQGPIYTGSEPLNSYKVFRCHITGGIQLSQLISNFSFVENSILDAISNNDGSASNCSFLNNIISAKFYNQFFNSVFKNNIFLSNTYCNYGCWYSSACTFSLLENNIFCANYGSYSLLSGISNSTFRNNLFVGAYALDGTNVGSNNIFSQEQSTIFVNYLGSGVFTYSDDYHLQLTCPGNNAGTDGTDIGIYGGIYPWKEGSIPTNPHFQSVNVAPVADSTGNLNVNIKVAAQDR